MAQMMAGLSKMMAPAMLGMAVGSMTGDLAQRCFGVHDLPIPRTDQRLKLIGANIDAFAAQWEIPLDEVRLWVLAHEFAGQAVLSSPNFATPLSAMVRQYVAAFRPDPDAVIEKLGGLDPTSGDPMEAIQQTLGDPAILLGAVSSEEQREMEPRLDAAVAAVVGFTDWIVDAVSVRVVGGSALRIAEAVRRQRVEQSPSDVFVHRLLGIRLDEEQVHSGKQFVQGVVDRVGDDAAIAMLLSGNDRCPTPSEIAAPGLWIARVSES
jgi:putative hydrolase